MNEKDKLEIAKKLDDLESVFLVTPDLELAILIGSRAIGISHLDSDWDFAIQWNKNLGFMEHLAATEKLRKELSMTLQANLSDIDLINIPTANLAMRAVVAEEGIVIKGAETLAWCHFLQRTWRELEEVYWEEIYAA